MRKLRTRILQPVDLTALPLEARQEIMAKRAEEQQWEYDTGVADRACMFFQINAATYNRLPWHVRAQMRAKCG